MINCRVCNTLFACVWFPAVPIVPTEAVRRASEIRHTLDIIRCNLLCRDARREVQIAGHAIRVLLAGAAGGAALWSLTSTRLAEDEGGARGRPPRAEPRPPGPPAAATLRARARPRGALARGTRAHSRQTAGQQPPRGRTGRRARPSPIPAHRQDLPPPWRRPDVPKCGTWCIARSAIPSSPCWPSTSAWRCGGDSCSKRIHLRRYNKVIHAPETEREGCGS